MPLITGIAFGLNGHSDKNAKKGLKALAGPYSYGRNILHLVFNILDILDPAALSLNDKLRMAEIFLKQGADILARDQRQITPLALAKHFGSAGVPMPELYPGPSDIKEALELAKKRFYSASSESERKDWKEIVEKIQKKFKINSKMNNAQTS